MNKQEIDIIRLGAKSYILESKENDIKALTAEIESIMQKEVIRLNAQNKALKEQVKNLILDRHMDEKNRKAYQDDLKGLQLWDEITGKTDKKEVSDVQALEAIQKIMSGTEWNSDTLEDIADIMYLNNRPINDIE